MSKFRGTTRAMINILNPGQHHNVHVDTEVAFPGLVSIERAKELAKLALQKFAEWGALTDEYICV